MHRYKLRQSLALAAYSLGCFLATHGMAEETVGRGRKSVSSHAGSSSLKEVYKGGFLIGVAMNASEVADENSPKFSIIKQQFNSVTAENAMKWGSINPQPGIFNFEAADRFVKFGNANQMFVVGHTLVWHSQVPKWVFEDEKGKPLTRDALLVRMRNYIHKVVGRYKGHVQGWDVVNEALAEDGSLRDSPWRKIIGDDYIAKAFQFAHEADPGAELYYNDYSIENPAKRAGAIKLLQSLKSARLRVDGVGIQEHVNLVWPTLKDLDESISAYKKLGLKVMITELDVNILPGAGNTGNAEVSRNEAADPALDPYREGLPPDAQMKLAGRYSDLFGIYLKHRGTVTRVTFWGLSDGTSWLNHWPIRGRTNHPLLFDRAFRPKPAFEAVIQAVSQ